MSTLSIVFRRGRKGAVCVVEHLLRLLGPGALGGDAHAGRLEVREEALVVGAADDRPCAPGCARAGSLCPEILFGGSSR